jgi:hypothetical protein
MGVLVQPWPGPELACDISTHPVAHMNSSSDIAVLLGSLWNPEGTEFFLQAVEELRQLGIATHQYGMCTPCNQNSTFAADHHFIHHHEYVSDIASESIARAALLAIDIRKPYHVRSEYVPDRWFKNVAWGVLVVTNSPMASRIFGKYAIASEDISTMIKEAVRVARDPHVAEDYVRHSSRIVAGGHTYANRLQVLVQLLAQTDQGGALF